MKPAIKKMIGKTYAWKNEQHKIKNIVQIAADMCRVTTTHKELQVSQDQLMEDFTEVITPEQEQTQLVIIGQATKEMESMRSLSDILMDNIKKVQKDSKYIDQAKSINESAKNIIELKKTQLEVVRLLKG